MGRSKGKKSIAPQQQIAFFTDEEIEKRRKMFRKEREKPTSPPTPKEIQAHLEAAKAQIAKALDQIKNSGNAKQIFSALLTYKANIAIVLSYTEDANKEEFSKNIHLALSRVRELGAINEVKAILEEILKENPNNIEILLLIAELHLDMPLVTFINLKKVIDLEPNNTEAHRILALLYLADKAKAEKLIQHWLKNENINDQTKEKLNKLNEDGPSVKDFSAINETELDAEGKELLNKFKKGRPTIADLKKLFTKLLSANKLEEAKKVLEVLELNITDTSIYRAQFNTAIDNLTN